MFYILTTRFEEWLDSVGLYRVVQVFTQLEFRALAAAIVAFLFVVLLGPKTIEWLRRTKVGDNPEFYNSELNALNQGKKDTPTMGGVLMCAAILVALFFFADVTSRYSQLAVVVLVLLACVGGFDDWLKLTAARRESGTREGLFAWEKLLFQLGIGAIAAVFLYQAADGTQNPAAVSLNLPFQRTYLPAPLASVTPVELNANVIVLGGLFYVLIGTLLIAGTSNAVNISDGMDGLATGTMVISVLVLTVLCFVAGRQDLAQHLLVPHVPGGRELTVVCGAMVGSCLGFLWFNCNPARVFMGDTGSLALGGLLAFIAVAIRQEVLLFLIAGIFYLELGSTAAQVLYFKATKGKRIFRCAPIHHHFHLGGWSEGQVVVRFWIITAILGAIALVSIKLR
ncbi:MAG: phospho-N-acetylmuramoyl-pentapeptide-transferase [Planctomycetota bacterium]|nr:MAG: phospho-N-acetylmuramoyl-pentapeptide-transferase [Planctomycetota bacterium]